MTAPTDVSVVFTQRVDQPHATEHGDGPRLVATGEMTDGAEPVKDFETRAGYLFCMSASREGSLIQASVGSLGGVGRRCRNRSGLAV
jgi:hypothetical protein